MLVLDHIFVRLSDATTARDRLTAAGLDLGFQRDHPGQGTANFCALFPDSFLELLYIRDAEEAAQNQLQLHARQSPLGIALRGPLSDDLRADWPLYPPPYGGGAFAFDLHPASVADTAVPLVFCMRPAGPRPADRPGLDPARLAHPCGAQGIAWIAMEGGAPPPIQAPWLRYAPGAGAPRLVVALQGARLAGPVEADPALVVCAAAEAYR